MIVRHVLLMFLLVLAAPLKATWQVPVWNQPAGPELMPLTHGARMFAASSSHQQCQAPGCQAQCQIQLQWPVAIPVSGFSGLLQGTQRPVTRILRYDSPFIETPLRPPLFA